MSLYSLPSAVLFDWDNTLVDTWPMIYGGMHAVFKKRGLTPWTLQEVKDRCHASGREAFPKLFPDDWQTALEDYYHYVRSQHLTELVLLPYAQQVLDFLSERSIPLAIVSNKTKKLLVDEINHLGFSNFFGVIIGAGDAALDKPDAAPLFMAMEQLAQSPSLSVCMIGDTPVDWAAARKAGVLAVGIGDGGLKHDDVKPHIHFQDLLGFFRLLQFLENKN